MATNEPTSTGGKLLFYAFFFIAGFFVFRWIIRLGLHLIGAYKHIAHSADSGSNLLALGLAAYCLYTLIAKQPSTVGIGATNPTKATGQRVEKTVFSIATHTPAIPFINLTNPFRGILILGGAGAGKSKSLIEPIITQTIHRGWTCLLYDFKFPTLARVAMQAT